MRKGLLAVVVGLVVASRPRIVEGEETDDSIEEYSTQVGEGRSLERLLEFAGDHAPELQEARERLGLGEAAMERAEKFQPVNPRVTGKVGVGLADGTFRSLEATLKQPLEIAGQRGLRIETAHRRQEMLQKQFSHARWEVRQRVRRLYRLGLLERTRLDLKREILAFTRQVLEIAGKRLEAGETSRTSVVVSRAEVASARRQVVDRWSGYIESVRTLGTTVG
jgi:cobalt-zinc-cadmium efflux system outer membrane protein